MALACTELFLSVPLSTFIIYLNLTTTQLSPWVSFYNTHYGFSRVDQIPALLWRANSEMVVAVELGRWIDPACAFIFFAYFGFADEARRHYLQAFWWCVKKLGFEPKSGNASSAFSSSAEKFGYENAEKKSGYVSVFPVLLPFQLCRLHCFFFVSLGGSSLLRFHHFAKPTVQPSTPLYHSIPLHLRSHPHHHFLSHLHPPPHLSLQVPPLTQPPLPLQPHPRTLLPKCTSSISP